MKTFTAKPETVKRDWFVVDAAGQTLGRLATEIASRLRASTSRNTPLTSILAITSS